VSLEISAESNLPSMSMISPTQPFEVGSVREDGYKVGDHLAKSRGNFVLGCVAAPEGRGAGYLYSERADMLAELGTHERARTRSEHY